MRRQKNEDDALDALFSRYALALSFFERWVKRGITTEREMESTLKGYGKEGECEQEKLDWLREQIEMRVIGLSWTEWKTPWQSSKDDDVGTVGQLITHLKRVLAEEAKLCNRNELPSKERALVSETALAAECPAPQFKRKTYKSLGTPTVQASQLGDDRIDMSQADLLAAAQKRRGELEAAGEIDWVSDRQPYAVGQGPTPDNNLIGKKLEVRWRYRMIETGEPTYMWCEGEVVKVADGEKDKMSARCKKILPAGAVQIRPVDTVRRRKEQHYTVVAARRKAAAHVSSHLPSLALRLTQ
ncbi:hypothetical protein AB1Y20_004970 [Prymnesium parvum]|uniref:Uncharacterized protein n=1 Tax=Prymnesium parvum TaxID=97485 RepID=A0AB34J462_PRYPA